ncbi:MAG: hypothetical protein A2020_15125 [Lentisphaerae bacterium GWF2_45_14]|nr:MAG: hypothetical protein A2020_15125 [Lentisphaerae bacterium GWF2_45_14]
MRTLLLIISVASAAAWFIPHGAAMEAENVKKFQFSKNGTFCEITSDAYTVRVRNAGSFVFSINDTMEIDSAFIHCWTHNQHFPYVNYVEAELIEKSLENKVIIKFKYFWDNGKVDYILTFTPRSVETAAYYMPFIEKNTSFIKFLFAVRKPVKPPAGIEIIAMERSIQANGALLCLDKWEAIRRPQFRMFSLRGFGKYYVDVLAEGNSWLDLWEWPRMSVSDNGDYPMWSKTAYKPGETKVLKNTIEIWNKDGKMVKDSPLKIKFYDRE